MKKINWKILFGSFVLVFFVATIGSFFTSMSVSSEWYETIKPEITPPDFVFPLVWSFLFFLIALSLYGVLVHSSGDKRKKIGIIFGINFFLNILWSVAFFGLMNPLIALFVLFALWFSILLMIFSSFKISPISGYLLIPYFLWVSFAGILNFLAI